jgi:hypothetical protein
LAAFLTCIDRLVRKALAGDLLDETQVLYVSPLKALGNDIQKNLEIVGRLDAGAIEEIRGEAWPDVRDAEELHDTLQTLIALPEISAGAEASEVGSLEDTVQRSVGAWGDFFEELIGQGRAARAVVTGRTYWVTAHPVQQCRQAAPCFRRGSLRRDRGIDCSRRHAHAVQLYGLSRRSKFNRRHRQPRDCAIRLHRRDARKS